MTPTPDPSQERAEPAHSCDLHIGPAGSCLICGLVFADVPSQERAEPTCPQCGWVNFEHEQGCVRAEVVLSDQHIVRLEHVTSEHVGRSDFFTALNIALRELQQRRASAGQGTAVQAATCNDCGAAITQGVLCASCWAVRANTPPQPIEAFNAPVTPQQDVEALVMLIQDELFTNGSGDKAVRLQMRGDGERDLGGWNKLAVAGAVRRALARVQPQPASARPDVAAWLDRRIAFHRRVVAENPYTTGNDGLRDKHEHAADVLEEERKSLARVPAPAARVDEWQPIETAPGGGWHFLAWCPSNRCTYIAANGGKEWYSDGEWRPAADVMAMFTHWRPLPEPPLAALQRAREGDR